MLRVGRAPDDVRRQEEVEVGLLVGVVAVAEQEADQRQVAAYRKNPTVSYRVTIKGAEHGSFSDETYPMPDKDGLAARRLQYTQAARTYILAFFDQTLLGKDAQVLKTVPSDLSEIVQTEKFGSGQ